MKKPIEGVDDGRILLRRHKAEVKKSKKSMDKYKEGVMGFGPMPQIVGMWSQNLREWVKILENMDALLRGDVKDPEVLETLADHCSAARAACLQDEHWVKCAKYGSAAVQPHVLAWHEDCNRRDEERKAALEERRAKRREK